jgi:integrase
MESDAHAGMYRADRATDRPFCEVVEAWRETRAPGLAPGTRARYEQILRTYLVPEFGAKKVSSLTREVVKRYFARLDAGGTGPGTLRKVHTTMSAVLSEAVELEMIRVNPCSGALRGRTKLDTKEMLFLKREEVATLAEAITPHYRVLVYTAAYTGLRASELEGLRVRDLDLARGVLNVRQSLKGVEGSDVPKGERDFGALKSRKARRTVPLPRFLRLMLAEHLAGRMTDRDGLVFLGPNGAPIRHNLFYKRHFKPAVQGKPATARKLAVPSALPERLSAPLPRPTAHVRVDVRRPGRRAERDRRPRRPLGDLDDRELRPPVRRSARPDRRRARHCVGGRRPRRAAPPGRRVARPSLPVTSDGRGQAPMDPTQP